MAIDLQSRGAAFRRQLLGDVEELIRRRISAIRVAPRIVNIPLVIGTSGVALAVNDHVFFRLGLNGTLTILTWSLAGTVAGVNASATIRIDVQIGATLATAASICGGTGNQPQLSAQAERSDQLPTGWAVQVADARWIEAIVATTGGTLEEVSLTLRCAVDSR